MRFELMVKSCLEFLTDLLYPPKCVFCDRVMDIGTKICICRVCRTEIEPLECPSSTDIAGAGFKTLYCDSMSAVYEYKGVVRQAVTRYKFQNKQSYFRTFSAVMTECLADMYKNRSLLGKIDFIICVPMHKKKERKRGYNQSALLSNEIAKILDLPERSGVLIKAVNVKSQSLSADISRYGNISGAYCVTETPETAKTVKNSKILIIDDVITTGSTLNECARALKSAGAARVYAFALATNKKELIARKAFPQLEKS